MKVPKKKLICRLLAIALVASPIFEWGIIPVHASESSGVTLTESYSETGNQNCEVTVNIGSGFTVKIPKKITLSGADGTSPYNVTVEGDIGASEIIKVKPDKDFNLKSSGKTDVTSTVTQSKTSFDYEDASKKDVSNVRVGTTTQGSVTAQGLSAGNWSGKFNFNISLEEKLEAGLYDKNGVMLASWDEAGIDLSVDYTYDNVVNETASGYYVLTNDYPDATKVVIPSDVTSIGTYAFCECINLTSVIISEGVTTIKDNAFYGCSFLTSVSLPDSLTTIGKSAFKSTRLTSVTIPEGVFSIDNNAFESCESLTNVTISSGVTAIGDRAFLSCSGLTSVTIEGNGLTTIGEGAVMNCTDLASVNIPDSVESIEAGAFSDCYSLTSVTIPDTVTTIGDYAFSGVQHIYYNGSATGSPWDAVAIN